MDKRKIESRYNPIQSKGDMLGKTKNSLKMRTLDYSEKTKRKCENYELLQERQQQI